jgi:hypothetical protein
MIEEGYEGLEPLLLNGRIRSLEVGQPKKGFSYTVGQRFKIGSTVCPVEEIIRDTNSYYLHGKLVYAIYIRVGDEIILWKSYEDVPVTVTYFID